MSVFALIASGLLCAALYYVCPRTVRWIWLLIASLAFYAYCSALYGLIITTLSVWAGALIVERVGLRKPPTDLQAEQKRQIKAAIRRRQRVVLMLVLLVNFGMLAVFKYANTVLGWLGRPRLSLMLPLGISFYTFQAIGYLLDVYRGQCAAEQNPAKLALFISFFPQLVQGPIGRYDALAPQLTQPHSFDLTAIERGFLLMTWGFFKKKVIADRALPLVEAVFSDHSPYGGAVIVLGVLLYSLQQYADFSGGIDLVTGIAELMGIRLATNFKRPYFAVSLGDFWRRWHITLGSWMRDYVFYPFALSKPIVRLGKAVKRTAGAHIARAIPAALGNVLVFLLVGLWHGATANYILWGLYNGVILASSALLEPAYKRFHASHPALVQSGIFHVLRVLRTFAVVNIGWFFDRSASARGAITMLGKTLFSPRFDQLTDGTLLRLGLKARDFHVLLIASLILFLVSFMQERGVHIREALFAKCRLPVRWAALSIFFLFVLATFVTSTGYDSGFLYAIF